MTEMSSLIFCSETPEEITMSETNDEVTDVRMTWQQCSPVTLMTTGRKKSTALRTSNSYGGSSAPAVARMSCSRSDTNAAIVSDWAGPMVRKRTPHDSRRHNFSPVDQGASSEEERAIRYLWAGQQAYLSVDLDFAFIDQYLGRLYEQPVLVIHDYGYVSSVKVGDCLGCAVGTVPSVVRVIAMPTRKRLRLRVVEGPQLDNTFQWKRDLLLPFWAHGRQRRLF
jgi:hypothetical protein